MKWRVERRWRLLQKFWGGNFTITRIFARETTSVSPYPGNSNGSRRKFSNIYCMYLKIERRPSPTRPVGTVSESQLKKIDGGRSEC